MVLTPPPLCACVSCSKPVRHIASRRRTRNSQGHQTLAFSVKPALRMTGVTLLVKAEERGQTRPLVPRWVSPVFRSILPGDFGLSPSLASVPLLHEHEGEWAL